MPKLYDMVKIFTVSKSTVVVCAASLLILLFVYAAVSKLMAFPSFRYSLSLSPLIGKQAALLALLVPAVELLIAALLFIPLTRKKGFLAAFVLLGLFNLYIGYMLLFAPVLPCSCGGILQSLGWKEHLLFNGIFTLLAGFGWGIIEKETHCTSTALLQ